MGTRVPFPTEFDPFLVQIVAVGMGKDLDSACEAAKSTLRKRATAIRTKWGFPTIHGMFYALTNRSERFSEPGVKSGTEATLTAWYQLDIEQNVMSPLPHRYVGHVGTNVIIEYDVVFCEGY
ncbi:MAG: hypothetical protein HC938_04795 [Nitrospira sp.]|nr:hypothetical protein [Nitrospira sp.]